jgi:glutamate racemase
LRDVIQKTVGASVKLIDSGEAAAETVGNLLKNKNLANLSVEQIAAERTLCDDLDHFFVTDAAERFARVAERFLGAQPARLEAVELWGNDELRTN